jgi:hypothetical protein
MQQVKYIEKRGVNKFQNYKYATEADVNEKIRECLAEQNILMVPSVKKQETREHQTRKGNIEYIARVEMDFTFMDGDTGESLTFSMNGEGQDPGDKAVYKAISGAQKYALMKLFMIPTGDDPEQDRDSEEQKTPAQQLSEAQVKRLFAIAKSHGVDVADVKKVLMKDYNKTTPEQLTKKEYDEICKRLENKAS